MEYVAYICRKADKDFERRECLRRREERRAKDREFLRLAFGD